MGNSIYTAQGTIPECEATTLTLRELQLCSAYLHTDMADVGPQGEGGVKEGLESIALSHALDTILVMWPSVAELLSGVRQEG